MVKVIEGQQAVTLDLAAASTTVGDNVEKSATNSTVKANTNANALAKATNRSVWYIPLAAVVLLGFFVFILRRSMLARVKRQ